MGCVLYTGTCLLSRGDAFWQTRVCCERGKMGSPVKNDSPLDCGEVDNER